VYSTAVPAAARARTAASSAERVCGSAPAVGRLHPPPLPAGQRPGPVPGHRRERELVEHPGDRRVEGPASQPGQPAEQLQVFPHGNGLIERDFLWRDPGQPPYGPAGPQRVPAGHQDLTRVRPDQPGDDLDERRLAGRHRQVEPGERQASPVPLHQPRSG
jgi:hypothetical protein